MAKITVQIEDVIPDAVQEVIDGVKDLLREYHKDNPSSSDSLPDPGDLDYSGALHEIVDGAVPIYNKEIKDTWYLYDDELEQAYENAGVGDNPRENNGMAAIYYLLQERLYEWYSKEAEEFWESLTSETEVNETN